MSGELYYEGLIVDGEMYVAFNGELLPLQDIADQNREMYRLLRNASDLMHKFCHGDNVTVEQIMDLVKQINNFLYPQT